MVRKGEEERWRRWPPEWWIALVRGKARTSASFVSPVNSHRRGVSFVPALPPRPLLPPLSSSSSPLFESALRFSAQNPRLSLRFTFYLPFFAIRSPRWPRSWCFMRPATQKTGAKSTIATFIELRCPISFLVLIPSPSFSVLIVVPVSSRDRCVPSIRICLPRSSSMRAATLSIVRTRAVTDRNGRKRSITMPKEGASTGFERILTVFVRLPSAAAGKLRGSRSGLLNETLIIGTSFVRRFHPSTSIEFVMPITNVAIEEQLIPSDYYNFNNYLCWLLNSER